MRWRVRVTLKKKVEVISGFVVEGETYVRGSGRHAVDGMRWTARACVVVEGANAKRKTHTQRDPEKKNNKCINVKKKKANKKQKKTNKISQTEEFWKQRTNIKKNKSNPSTCCKLLMQAEQQVERFEKRMRKNPQGIQNIPTNQHRI